RMVYRTCGRRHLVQHSSFRRSWASQLSHGHDRSIRSAPWLTHSPESPRREDGRSAVSADSSMVGQTRTAGGLRILSASSPCSRAVLLASINRHAESTAYVQPMGTGGRADLVGGGCRGSHSGLAARPILRPTGGKKTKWARRAVGLPPSSPPPFSIG